MIRKSKDQYYLDIALKVSERSTCLRRQYGAIVVKDDRIVSTGYNGSPRGAENCNDVGFCYRELHGIPHGERYEECVSVHAEANAIVAGNRLDLIGSTLYLAGYERGRELEDPRPCKMCERLIRQAGIETVITRKGEVLKCK